MGLTWFEQPTDAWRKKYPYVTKKIDELEARIEQREKTKDNGSDEKSYQDAF